MRYEFREGVTWRVAPLRDLWKECGRDGRMMAALALYEGLVREADVADGEQT